MNLTISEEFLLAIAQIAIALIGFSGVVAALDRRGERDWTSAELLQLRTLVEPSIVAFAAAFIPFGLSLLDLENDALWRVSNGIILSLHAIFNGLFFLRRVRGGGHVGQNLIQIVAFMVYALLLASVLNITSYHQFAFLIGLLLGISVSVVNFYLLLFSPKESAA